jgi:nitrogenase molybdenum-iron protein alpha/beta subunit
MLKKENEKENEKEKENKNKNKHDNKEQIPPIPCPVAGAAILLRGEAWGSCAER